MAENTSIEWCDHTFNPWIGCTKVSLAETGGGGCDHCYAEVSTPARSMRIEWGAHAARHRTAAETWKQPKRWNDRHAAFFAEHGRRQRVFCASLADVFDNQVPEGWRLDLFRLIRDTPNLDWLLLTKRIGNAPSMIADALLQISAIPEKVPTWPWLNVWLGATVVNQEEADRDIPKLLATPAAVRFLSMEPLLGPVQLTHLRVNGVVTVDALRGWAAGIGEPRPLNEDLLTGRIYPRQPAAGPRLDWVIAGGESGQGARPMHPDWARGLRDQCAAAGVPFIFKQWGEWLPWSQFCDAKVDDETEQTRFQTREYEGGEWRDVGRPGYWDSMDGAIDDQQCVGKVGKKAAGRLLDGVEHNGFPSA